MKSKRLCCEGADDERGLGRRVVTPLKRRSEERARLPLAGFDTTPPQPTAWCGCSFRGVRPVPTIVHRSSSVRLAAMNSRPHDCDSVQVTLSVRECRFLGHLLTQQLANSARPEIMQCADRVLTMVGDTHAVAVWLGESAALELPSNDAELVLEMLDMCRVSEAVAPEERELLQSVRAALLGYPSLCSRP